MNSPFTRCYKKRLLLVGILFIITNSGLTAQGIVPDSLKLLLRSAPEEEKIDVYQAIITKIWRNNPDSALVYSKKAIRFAEALNDYRSRAIAVRLCGGSYFYLGNYDSSLYYTKQACKLSIESKDSTLISSSLSNLGEVYVLMGNYPEGLENLLHSLHIKRTIDQKYGLANTLNNTSLAYLKLKDYAKAREYSLEAIKISGETGDHNPNLYANNNLGFTYLYSGQLGEAKKYFMQSISIAEATPNLSWHAVAYSGLGQAYLGSDQPNQARLYFNKALGFYIEINDKVGISEMYHLISRIHAKNGNLDSAFYFVELSKKSAQASGSRERRLDNFRLLEELYTQQKKYDQALVYKSRYMALHDSMFNESMLRTLSNIELKVSEEENQRALATKDILIQKKTIQTYFLIAIVLIVVVFSVVLFRSYKLIKEKTHELARSKEEIVQKADLLEEANNDILLKNEELEQQTEEIMAQRDRLAAAQEIIESKNKELEGANVLLEKKVMLRTKELKMANQDLLESNKDLDHFIYRSSHDLKGPLTRLLGLSHLGKIETEETKAKEYFEKLELSAHEMNEMLTRLINIHEISVRTITSTSINLKAKITEIFTKINDRLQSHGLVQFDNRIDDDVRLSTDEYLIENLFFIIIENAIQYRDQQKTERYLHVSTRQTDSSLRINFTDNGVGISPELREHLFDMFVIGDHISKGHGLGLYEAKVIVKKLKGTLVLLDSKKEVTEFEITLPSGGRLLTSVK